MPLFQKFKLSCERIQMMTNKTYFSKWNGNWNAAKDRQQINLLNDGNWKPIQWGIQKPKTKMEQPSFTKMCNNNCANINPKMIVCQIHFVFKIVTHLIKGFHFVWLDLILNLNDALFSHHYFEKRKVFGVAQMAKLWNVAHSKYFPLSIQFIFWLTKSDELSFNCLTIESISLWLSQWNSFLNLTGLMWYVWGNVFHSSYLQPSCMKLWSDERRETDKRKTQFE